MRRWLKWWFRLVGDALLGAPPFYELARFDETPAIGGGKAVRGVPAQRYYGKVKVFGNLEVRSDDSCRSRLVGKTLMLGVAAFIDVGRTWTELGTTHPELDGTGSGSSTAWAAASVCRRGRPSSSGPTWRGRPTRSRSARTSPPERSSRAAVARNTQRKPERNP